VLAFRDRSGRGKKKVAKIFTRGIPKKKEKKLTKPLEWFTLIEKKEIRIPQD
jgi:hypothetical protein